MRLETRHLLDRSFSGLGFVAIFFMAASLVVILLPIIVKGLSAYLFTGTIEFREAMNDQFDHGDRAAVQAEARLAEQARQPLYDCLTAFADGQSKQLDRLTAIAQGMAAREDSLGRSVARKMRRFDPQAPFSSQLKTLQGVYDRAAANRGAVDVVDELAEMNTILAGLSTLNEKVEAFEHALSELLGPLPGQTPPRLLRSQYGQTRWDRALIKQRQFLFEEEWVHPPDGAPSYIKETPRIEHFRGTALEPAFALIEHDLESMLRPKFTFYWRFLTDTSKDANFFGGIWAEVLGTFYLTLGAMLFAVPMGVIAAIYLCEYAKPSRFISFLRTCISTLAGVPSIVFGLFGLAFFLNTLEVSHNKSVLAGSMTLALMILPTIIRASEEAILAVPQTYKEAALGLGAGRWHTVLTVVLPASLPGILTGIVISMGRAAGETAPIIFTAAVSVGQPLSIFKAFSQPTPALPWNIYNLCTEHEAVNELRHVQFGMVFTLVAMVLILNLSAIILRAKVSKKLRG
ncbi:MAG: phosphate ABC transporter permease PstA [Lentisphaeria bacterium]|nr:phosphate ABC transporter permease PstA [Lentisphaeria bacterium]